MPKRGRHRRGGGRVIPTGTRPLSSGGGRPAGVLGVAVGHGGGIGGRAARAALGSAGPGEPSLLTEVRRALRYDEPLGLLDVVSSMLAAVGRPGGPSPSGPLGRDSSPRSAEPSLDTLVRSFAEIDGPETTALLAVVAQLSDDELVRERARRALTVRGGRLHRLPEWIRRLGDSASLVGAEIVHPLGDGENVVLGVRVPPDHDLSVVVYVDHNLGTVVKDAFVVLEHVESMARIMVREGDDPDLTWRPIRIADAGARVAGAIETWAMTDPPLETDNWPACRPLVEWVLRLIPGGGKGYELPEWTAAQRDELARRFVASPFGARHDSADRLGLVDALLWFGADYGPRDPLLWSPVRVEILLTDWVPRKVLAPAGELARVPDVLRDLVRFSHAERGIRRGLTSETLDAVDRWQPEYLGLVLGGEPSSEGALAELALDSLADEVGGQRELMALDDAPLPDEDLAWAGIPEDVRARVRDVAELCDRWCEEVAGASSGGTSGGPAGEYRTACRRFLAAVAAGDPRVFRRRSKPESAAAAVCWAVGSANRLFHPRHGGLLVKDLAAYFGVSGNPSARGRMFLEAAGPGFGFLDGGAGPVRLDARFLVSGYRRWLAAERDRYLAEG